MPEPGAYHSIAAEASAEIMIKGSRFIAHARPVAKKQHAEHYVAAISERFRDATHNCFAFKIGAGDGASFRYSDAGEPSGTAGRPILQAIEARELTNVVVVVTRYFGGTRLGAGGLLRAYSAATLAALENARIVTHHATVRMRLRFAYDLTNPVHQVLDKFNAAVLDSQFEQETRYRVQLKAVDDAAFREAMRDATSGKIEIT